MAAATATATLTTLAARQGGSAPLVRPGGR